MIQPMQHLWAPWRMEFIKGPKPSGCFFCEAAAADPSDDAKHLVLARTEFALAILNRYPYNNGHLMVAPKAHLANLEDLPAATANDVIALTQRALRALRQILAPHGFNLGINQGELACQRNQNLGCHGLIARRFFCAATGKTGTPNIFPG